MSEVTSLSFSTEMDAAESSTPGNLSEVPEQQAEQMDCQDDIQIASETTASHEPRSFQVEESVPHGVSATGGDQTRPYKAAGHGQPSSGSSRSSQFQNIVAGGRGHGRTAENGSFLAHSGMNHEAYTSMETEMLWHETLDVMNEMFTAGDLDPSWAPTLQKCYEEKWQSHSARMEPKTRR